MGPQLRAVAATAREALIDLAAARWKVSRDELDGRERQDRRPRHEAIPLLRRADPRREPRQDPPRRRRSAPVSPPSNWKIAGTPAPRSTAATSSPARHKYASDIDAPRDAPRQDPAPASRSRRRSSRSTPRRPRRSPGVKVVRDGDFVGVVAPDLSTAERALAALASAKWKETPGQPSNAEHLRVPEEERRRRDDRAEPRVTGSVEAGLASADVKLSQTYTVEYIAHAPLEPRAAVAEWKRRQAHGLDRHAAPLRRARGARRGVPHPERERARARPRHRLRLRRQAHRRRGGRGRAPGEGGRQAGQGRLDARGGVHLGLLPPGRRHRGPQRRARTARSSRGSSTTTTPAPPASRRPTTSPTRRSSSTPSSRRCARAPTARSPRPRTTSRARATWTSSRTRSAWIRSRSA